MSGQDGGTANRAAATPPGDAGPALFRLVRFWARRWAPDVVQKLDEGAPDTWTVQNLYVIQAIHGASMAGTRNSSGGEVTVADVAKQLGLDRSVASRMIADAVRDGYVSRHTSAQDARRARLSLTEAAEEFLAASNKHQQQAFEDLVSRWPADDRRRFAGYLRRLAGEVLDTP
ncbi:MarR family winged helix-turn-helix transcriptional regulator [Amycolatopsis nigrescens]|uniref:MarR family winged helix-turn-helix transcriptional regulator n=1 Tax=Amycolatopsis nigrescens TaxID=381445 RepID=UPI00036A36D9|nr:MarR family winged helix-turn-helix transcriptional regulator [Amycolatopsis nigrescens]